MIMEEFFSGIKLYFRRCGCDVELITELSLSNTISFGSRTETTEQKQELQQNGGPN